MEFVIGILIFCLIIIIHEMGHFFAAKACGVRVNEFAIGMGPTIFKIQGKETKYALRLFPIGGFVSMEGEDDESDDPRAFIKKPVWQRMIIIVAGAFMNIILGFVVLIIVLSTAEGIPSTTIGGFHDNAVSSESLQPNDKILKVNGTRIFTYTDINYKMKNSKAEIIDNKFTYQFVVERNGEKITLDNVQFAAIQNGADTTAYHDFKVFGIEKTFFNIISTSFANTISVSRIIWMTFIDLITGEYGLNDISGPVGVVKEVGEIARNNLPDVLSMLVFITINVGVFNLFPIPALDGARFVFLLIELIRRKRIKPEHEGMVHFVGLVLLFGLMIVVTFKDISTIFF